MPFVSEQQRRFLYSQHPDIAKRWEKETPKGKKLPKYKSADKLQKYFGGLVSKKD
jgi:hypothetical protein